MKRPNFFIVGAPKCGTTALSEYLRAHEQVFMCEPKEPKFFVEALGHLREAATEPEYLELFKEAGERHVAVGEASVWYLYFSESLPRIKAFAPDARIIVMLRNPVDLVYALHAQCLFNLLESETDFEAAWRLQDVRARGEAMPEGNPTPRTLLYGEIGKIGSQLENLYAYFPPEQVQVLLFDDFKTDAGAVYRRTLQFLGLPDDGRAEFPPVNENKRLRSQALGRFNRRPPRLWQAGAARVKRLLRIEGPVGLYNWMSRWNVVAEQRAPLSPEFRAELEAHFADDVALLSDLMHRDLSHWQTTARAVS